MVEFGCEAQAATRGGSGKSLESDMNFREHLLFRFLGWLERKVLRPRDCCIVPFADGVPVIHCNGTDYTVDLSRPHGNKIISKAIEFGCEAQAATRGGRANHSGC